MKTLGSWFGSIGMGLLLGSVLVGCAGPAADRASKPLDGQAVAVSSARSATPVVVAASPPTAATTTQVTSVAGPSAVKSPSKAPETANASTAAITNVKVKRLVVTRAVKDREPAETSGALPSDGTAIFAFAELSNAEGASGNVRITFERKGGAEKVGDVSLPVPGNVSRHRTWAFTRFIRVPGVWEAVVWSDTGNELGRASFEVTAS